MAIKLTPGQVEAVNKMGNGKILCGAMGSGKSLTALAYYVKEHGGNIPPVESDIFWPMDGSKLEPLYIITTAFKRDKLEWEGEMAKCCIGGSKGFYPELKIVVDSWNNIKKYIDVENAFFIFDEQKVTGSGVWVKSFLKITKKNKWILLSATPGDVYLDYVPIWIANGYFKNRTQFNSDHVIFNRFTPYPKPEKYINTEYLDILIDKVLVQLPYIHTIIYNINELDCKYDKDLYNKVLKERQDPFKNNEPIQTAAEFCYTLRKINNSDESRLQNVLDIYNKHNKVIVFYNFDYELEALLQLKDKYGYTVNQRNGHKHEGVPYGKKWVYLVNYMSGCEGWNCIETNCIVFYSNNYSYKMMKQAAGRIDRMNTPFAELYYYILETDSNIEKGILKALTAKQDFNEKIFSAKFGT